VGEARQRMHVPQPQADPAAGRACRQYRCCGGARPGSGGLVPAV